MHIEWFDTEIDSIIEIPSGNNERNFRDSVSIQNNNIETSPLQRKINTLNNHLLETVISDTNVDTILIG